MTRSIREEDILFWAGGNVLQKYGTLVRRTRPDAPEIDFTRGSRGALIGRTGVFREADQHVPRIHWLDWNGDGVRETPTLLLEHASTNLVPNVNGRPANMSAFGTTPPTVQVEARQTPFGSECWAITFPNPVTPGFAGSRATSQPDTFAVTAGLPYARTLWVAGDTTGITIRHTGVIGLDPAATPTGREIAVGGLVWREFTGVATAGSTGSDYLSIEALDSRAAGKTIRIAGHQVEQAPVPSSLILGSPAPVTRARDVLTSPWPHAPQAMTGYLRFVEAGAIVSTAGSAVLQRIGMSSGPNIWIGRGAGSQSYGVTYQNIATAVSTLPASPAPQIGDVVELVWRLYPDGAVRIEQSINGGAPVVAGRSTAVGLAAAWNVPTLRLGGTPSGFNEAPAAWRDAVVLRGSGWTMDQIREVVG